MGVGVGKGGRAGGGERGETRLVCKIKKTVLKKKIKNGKKIKIELTYMILGSIMASLRKICFC